MPAYVSPPQGFYAASAPPPPARASFAGTDEAELCIIGGGFTGLSAALHLAQSGSAPVLLEAEEFGYGASGRNGGQIHSGLRRDQTELEAGLGTARAEELWQLCEAAKALVRMLARQVGCPVTDGLLVAAHSPRAFAHLRRDTEHLQRRYGYHAMRLLDAEETAAATGSRLYYGARFDAGGGHVHPLALARGLAAAAAAAGARLYVRSKVEAIEPGSNGVRVICARGELRARRVLVACDAWTGALLPQLAPYLARIESFLIATEPLPTELAAGILPSDAAVADTRHVLDYYRKSSDHRLLFAGGEGYLRQPRDVAARVRPRMLKVFPQLQAVGIDFAWSGTVAVTRSRLPQFGRLGSNILYGHGYSGQGVALALLGGRFLAEAARGFSPGFETLARLPHKSFPGGPILRQPLVAAALQAFRLSDALG